MTEVPEYIQRRIRQPIPADLCVIPGTTPVVAFGDARKAKVATLAFNPSYHEFQDKDGRELTGSCRRLATHRSLGVSDLAYACEETIEQVLNDCNSYFQRKPYGWWFNQLDLILKACGVSYYEGSACHLDLVQWATKSRWNCLSGTVRNRLLDSDVGFLRDQLCNENIELLLVNGNGVADVLKKSLETRLDVICMDSLGPIPGFGGNATYLYEGHVLNKVRVIAWNVNLQSSRGVSNALRHTLALRVGQIA